MTNEPKHEKSLATHLTEMSIAFLVGALFIAVGGLLYISQVVTL